MFCIEYSGDNAFADVVSETDKNSRLLLMAFIFITEKGSSPVLDDCRLVGLVSGLSPKDACDAAFHLMGYGRLRIRSGDGTELDPYDDAALEGLCALFGVGG